MRGAVVEPHAGGEVAAAGHRPADVVARAQGSSVSRLQPPTSPARGFESGWGPWGRRGLSILGLELRDEVAATARRSDVVEAHARINRQSGSHASCPGRRTRC